METKIIFFNVSYAHNESIVKRESLNPEVEVYDIKCAGTEWVEAEIVDCIDGKEERFIPDGVDPELLLKSSKKLKPLTDGDFAILINTVDDNTDLDMEYVRVAKVNTVKTYILLPYKAAFPESEENSYIKQLTKAEHKDASFSFVAVNCRAITQIDYTIAKHWDNNHNLHEFPKKLLQNKKLEIPRPETIQALKNLSRKMGKDLPEKAFNYALVRCIYIKED